MSHKLSINTIHTQDIEIIQQVISGDMDKFSVIVERYQHRIYLFVLRCGITHAAAEDLMQDIFMQAYSGLPSFRNESPFINWLYGIARNVVNNYINRTLPKERAHSSEVNAEKLPAGTKTVHQELIIREQHHALIKAINNMPDKLRETLILVFFEEFSYRETGEIMDIPEGTVKSRIFKARKMLCEMNLSNK